VSSTLHHFLLRRLNEGDWIDSACSTHVRDEKYIQNFVIATDEKMHLEDLGIERVLIS
jgi:hypothetical protein